MSSTASHPSSPLSIVNLMPTRTAVASRRFYRALHEWTLLTSPAAATAAGGGGRGVHTTSPAQKEWSIRRLPLDRARESKVSRETRASAAEPLHGEKESRRVHKPRNDHGSEAWRTGPVHTATEKPFSTLQPYDVVVRYRSEYGVMLEVAVPEHHLQKMQETLGNRLELLSKDHDARVEVQQLSAPVTISGVQDARIVSVLVSGTFTQTHNIVGQMRNYQIPSHNADARVFSHLARPSATLRAKEDVLRESSEQFTRVQLSADRQAVSLENDSSPVPFGGLSSSGGLRSNGSAESARSGVTHSKIPKADIKLAGESTTGLQVCRATIVGPNSEGLRSMIPRPLWPSQKSFERPKLRYMLAPKAHPDMIVTSAKPPHIQRFQSQMRTRIDELCTANNFAPHGVEFHTEAFDDATSRRDDLTIGPAILIGPNADHLLAVLSSDLPEGWRLYNIAEPCRFDKNENTLTFTGTAAGVATAKRHARRRLQQLCTALGYPPHDLSIPTHAVDPSKNAKLVTDVRDTLRALTHPVVLITARDLGFRTRTARHSSDGRGSRGATVSSFNTVTLDPLPMVSFNLKLPSRTWNAIKSSERFVVHVLSASPRGAAIADAFARTHDTPRSGFNVVSEMGVALRQPFANREPIYLIDKLGGGVLAQMVVHLLSHKCVEVGDHVIVVGMVRKVVLGDAADQSALSYSMRSYRGPTGRLEPDFTPVVGEMGNTHESSHGQSSSPGTDHSPTAAQIAQHDTELDPLRLGERLDVGAEHMSHPPSQQEAQSTSPASDEDLDDPVYKALMSARELVRQEEAIDMYEAFNSRGGEAPFQQRPQDKVEEHAKRAAKAQQEEEEYDFGFDEPDHASTFHEHDGAHGEVLQEPPRTAQARATSSSAWTLAGPSSKRSFSTLARSLNVLSRSPLPPYRSASTLAESRISKDMSNVLDPATAQSTVSDYLSFSDNTYDEQGNFTLYVKQVGVRGSLVAKQDITRLKDLLARGYKVSKTGEDIALRPAEISGIEHKIVLSERKICINLAVNAMRTLRDMLDKARYGELFWRRVPYMERLIEQGMATLMQEARELRSLLDGGKIERKRYDVLSAQMKGRYDAMEIEVGRLRQVTEEEGDAGVKDFDDDV